MFSPFRAVLAGVTVATVVLLPVLPAQAAAGSTPPATPACTAPRAGLSYTPESFTWGMTVDYTGCDWWDGGTIELFGSLRRLDGRWANMTSEPKCFRPVGTTFPASCRILLELDHPAHEVARYRGAIYYKWQDGWRTETLSLRCTNTPTMRTCVWDDTDG